MDTTRPKTHFTKKELKARNWNHAMVQYFIPVPHKVVKNPMSRGETYLYEIPVVELIETTDEFKEKQAKFLRHKEKRKSGSEKAISTKIQQLKDLVEGITIELPRYPLEELIREAKESYAKYREEESHIYDNVAQRLFLHRITVNYIRHQITDYDYIIENQLRGKTGKEQAYVMLKEKILRTIGEVYPELASECERQIEYSKKQKELRDIY